MPRRPALTPATEAPLGAAGAEDEAAAPAAAVVLGLAEVAAALLVVAGAAVVVGATELATLETLEMAEDAGALAAGPDDAGAEALPTAELDSVFPTQEESEPATASKGALWEVNPVESINFNPSLPGAWLTFQVNEVPVCDPRSRMGAPVGLLPSTTDRM